MMLGSPLHHMRRHIMADWFFFLRSRLMVGLGVVSLIHPALLLMVLTAFNDYFPDILFH